MACCLDVWNSLGLSILCESDCMQRMSYFELTIAQRTEGHTCPKSDTDKMSWLSNSFMSVI